MRTLLAVSLAVLLIAAAWSAPLPPESPPLLVAVEFRTARLNGENLEIDRVETVYEYRTRVVEREIDGRKIREQVTEAVPVTRIVRDSQPFKDVKAVNAEGKPVDADTLAKRLARSTTVLVVLGEAQAPPALRGLLRDDVLIIGLPVKAMPRPVKDFPMPPRDLPKDAPRRD
jgi:hypothetical protein